MNIVATGNPSIFFKLALPLVKIPRKPRHFSNGIQAERRLDSLSIK